MMQGIGQMEKLSYSDLLGAVASGLCAIHCALTPVFFAAKPVLESTMGQHSHGEGVWALLDYLFLILSLAAVWYSARHTNHIRIKRVLWGAWAVFAIGLLSEPFHLHHGKWFMYIGSITLVVAHVYNHRYCRMSPLKTPIDDTNKHSE
ncbi:MerC domain-containing protein [Ulvibacterium sp.]|uniref:MerC domain-containing protein n=1 Tax=Ulvibacterium sp. TaxID=2665914 RepID=UPI003BABDBDA